MSGGDPEVVRFPFSRVRPGPADPARDLGLTPLSRMIGRGGRGAKGHWCSRCQGIWYSYFLEAQCPVCGSRSG